EHQISRREVVRPLEKGAADSGQCRNAIVEDAKRAAKKDADGTNCASILGRTQPVAMGLARLSSVHLRGTCRSTTRATSPCLRRNISATRLMLNTWLCRDTPA